MTPFRPAEVLEFTLQRDAWSRITLKRELQHFGPLKSLPVTDLTLADLRAHLTAAVVCDALDAEGFPHQSPRVPLRPLTVPGVLVGRCKTTLWADMAHPDPRPYELELQAVDTCRPDDVLICAAGGSVRSGIWGELLSTAARNRIHADHVPPRRQQPRYKLPPHKSACSGYDDGHCVWSFINNGRKMSGERPA